jgi:RES domain-containing protein
MPQYATSTASAFSGEGAARSGGRWNSRGTSVVYASTTMSLAALETLVHLNPQSFFRYVSFELTFETSLVETFPVDSLVISWRENPPPNSAKTIGDTWVKEGRSAILALPSAIIPCESNLLLNPKHPDFKKINIHKPRSFGFDPRLLT